MANKYKIVSIGIFAAVFAMAFIAYPRVGALVPVTICVNYFENKTNIYNEGVMLDRKI